MISSISLSGFINFLFYLLILSWIGSSYLSFFNEVTFFFTTLRCFGISFSPENAGEDLLLFNCFYMLLFKYFSSLFSILSPGAALQVRLHYATEEGLLASIFLPATSILQGTGLSLPNVADPVLHSKDASQ